MEKILLAINAVQPNKNALEFACYLGRLTKSKVTGVFLENLVAEERPVLKNARQIASLDWEVDEFSEEHKAKVELIERNISLFQHGCCNGEVNSVVHRDTGLPASELIKESRFADLMVIDAETSFNKRFEGTPTEFVRDVLRGSECPVIIAPEKFRGVDEIIFTYNGTPSSVFAIKQFTYLFPEFKYKKITIVQVNESGEWKPADKSKFDEWLTNHYANLNFEALKGNAETTLFDHLYNKRNIFLVMGSYGRNALSQFIKPSHADLLIKTVMQPIFIAHP